jgi:hypothetical protein
MLVIKQDAYQSNFLVSLLGLKQQMLIYQISLVQKAGQRTTDANNSNFIGQQAGETATLLIMASLVMVLVIMQQMLHTQFLWKVI